SGIAGVRGSDGKVQWHRGVGAINWSPLVVGDTIFLCSQPQIGTPLMLWALHRADGTVVWSTPLTDATGGFNPLLGADANTVLVNTYANLDAFDAATGHLRWQHAAQADGRPTSTTQIALYSERTPDDHAKLIALHTATGTLAWSQSLFINNTPIRAGDKAIFVSAQTVYFPDADQRIAAVNLADGHPRWHSQETGIVVAGGPQTVVVKHGYHPTTLLGLDATSGQRLWSMPLVTDLVTVSLAGTTLVTASGATIVAADARTGKELWRKALNAAYSTNLPLMLDGVLFLYSENSQAHGSPGCAGWQACPDYLYALHPDTGKSYWEDTLTDANGMALQEGDA
ncbi:MAG: PQQ-binding-like beta-propeller repeat protein, partial [Ktedonobacterales bacterium]|nr:PQQ-binding-like beta-propeller repeat protein [Ktedonobacterales bacterium]